MVTEKEIFAKGHERLADYGFIVRYPDEKEVITGHDYEPWHIRYARKDAAKEIMDNGITLEEYLHVPELN